MFRLKTENIPVVSMLLVLSWVFLVLAVLVPGVLLFIVPWQRSWVSAAAACVGGVGVSVVLRAFAKTCQMIFDIKKTGFDLCGLLRSGVQAQEQACASLQRLEAMITQNKADDRRQLAEIRGQIERLQLESRQASGQLLDVQDRAGKTLEQVNCDTRDLNRCVEQLRVFFETIERHLGLRKG